MIVLGANSDISKKFTELVLQKEDIRKVYLLSSKPDKTINFGSHLKVKYNVDVEIIKLDLLDTPKIDFSAMDYSLVFCASGYMGAQQEADISNNDDNARITAINYSNLILVLNEIAQDMERKGKGTIIGVSSVAGERGRKSNFIYGSAKAGFTAYLSGLRNYFNKKGIHVLTVKPGFMYTKMTEDLELPKALTITPEKAAKLIYRGYIKKRNVIYIAWMWKWIMLIIKSIPEFIFKRLSL